MNPIDHPVLGRLEYEDEDGWSGEIDLPLFAVCDTIGLDRANRKLADLIGGFDDESAGADDAEPMDRKKEPCHRIRIYINESGNATLTPAQERTLLYLMENEAEVLETILESLFNDYSSSLDDLRQFHSQFDEGTLDDIVPQLDDAAGLKELVRFSEIRIGGDVVDGFIPVHIHGACTWDEEHGFEIEVLRGRVLGESDAVNLFNPFPCPLPTSVNVEAMPRDENGLRLVEFRIHGRWTGIFQVDAQQQIAGQPNYCLLCRGPAWDPEGVDAVRAAPPEHLKKSASHYIATFGAAMAVGIFLAPMLLILGILVWPGLFWGSLVASTFAVWNLLTSPLFRDHRPRRLIGAGAMIMCLSITGLVAWHRYDAFASINFGMAVGWLIWCLAALACLFAASIASYILAGIGASERRVGLLLSLPFLAFGGFVGFALWKTAVGSFSRFHLIWITPVTLFISLFIGLASSMIHLRWLGKQLDATMPKRKTDNRDDAE